MISPHIAKKIIPLADKKIAKKRISLYSREPNDVKFVITERDVLILASINQYRYLSTDQIHKIAFSENKTLQSVRRRLKYLFHHKYIGRVIPYVQQGQNASTIAYYLDKEGETYLKEQGHTVKLWTKAKKIKHSNLLHALALSEFCININDALKNNASMGLERLIPDFEMKSTTDKSLGRRRYKLFTEVIHGTSRKSYIVYPDALIILTVKVEQVIHKRLVFLEIDRGTMNLERIRDKLIGYNLYLEKSLHKNYLDSDDFRILIQTTSPKRVENIRNALADMKGSDLVWITDVTQVNSETLLNENIWADTKGGINKFIRV